MIHLKNGRRITADRVWIESDQVFYERNGATFGIPRSLLDRVESAEPHSSPETAGQPATPVPGNVAPILERARESVKEGHLDEAAHLYQEALGAAPDLALLRLELAEVLIARGEVASAQSQLEVAKRIQPSDSRVREKLGDVYYRTAQTGLAIREWQKAAEIAPRPDLLDKLHRALRENTDDVDFDDLRHPPFLLRYHGTVGETLSREIAAALSEEYTRLGRDLRFAPAEPLTVSLEAQLSPEEAVTTSSWVPIGGEGRIVLPVQGLDALTPPLHQILRHHLAHTFVDARTRGNCPLWFREGLAQMRAGEPPPDLYQTLRRARGARSLLPLSSLEAPRTDLGAEKARLAHLESLAAVRYLADWKSPQVLPDILSRLANAERMNEVLKKILDVDYRGLEAAWQADLDRHP